MKDKHKDRDGLFKSIFTAYFILLLHVLLLAGVGLSVVLFKGVYHYLPWVMGGLGILVLSVTWFLYRYMRQSTSDIRSILSVPEFQDRTVEMRFLGGLASFKVQAKQPDTPLLDHPDNTRLGDNLLIENSADRAERKMLELNTLYEKNLISRDEFEKARQTVIQG